MTEVKWRQWNTIPNADNDLISRSALLADIGESVVFSGRSGETSAEMRGAHKVVDRIKAAPAVDAVEVVRCRECKFCKKHPTAEGYKLCTNYNWNNEYHPFTEDEHFCSYGKRRSE